mmetsp:Transcript_4371/g.13110  ORF Transcript_4371/g.13110 Transcript_4371/m.13110 type:complete len:204 (-) Transcript_4371:237-848(-)
MFSPFAPCLIAPAFGVARWLQDSHPSNSSTGCTVNFYALYPHIQCSTFKGFGRQADSTEACSRVPRGVAWITSMSRSICCATPHSRWRTRLSPRFAWLSGSSARTKRRWHLGASLASPPCTSGDARARALPARRRREALLRIAACRDHHRHVLFALALQAGRHPLRRALRAPRLLCGLVTHSKGRPGRHRIAWSAAWIARRRG